MKSDNTIEKEMLPYEKLAVLGIDRQKADALPEDVKRKLVSGEVTPLMQVSIKARNGDVITLPLKLQLTADKYGQPALIAYPVRAELDKERNAALLLTDQEVMKLKRGDVIQKNLDLDGERTKHYLQLDPETKSIIHRKASDIQLEQKLKDMEKIVANREQSRACSDSAEVQHDFAVGKVNDIELGTQHYCNALIGKQKIR